MFGRFLLSALADFCLLFTPEKQSFTRFALSSPKRGVIHGIFRLRSTSTIHRLQDRRWELRRLRLSACNFIEPKLCVLSASPLLPRVRPGVTPTFLSVPREGEKVLRAEHQGCFESGSTITTWNLEPTLSPIRRTQSAFLCVLQIAHVKRLSTLLFTLREGRMRCYLTFLVSPYDRSFDSRFEGSRASTLVL